MLPRGIVVATTALVVLTAHTLLLPTIWFYPGLLTFQEKLDASLIVAPLTSAYFFAVVRFGTQNAGNQIFDPKDRVNFLFPTVAGFAIVPFLAGLYVVVILQANNMLGPLAGGAGSDSSAAMKATIGVLELFFGGAFSYFVGTLFGADKPATPPAGQ